jgi:hypothetical protein
LPALSLTRLGFHQARLNDYNGPASPEATKIMFDSYPADIRGWLNARGGLEKMPYAVGDGLQGVNEHPHLSAAPDALELVPGIHRPGGAF